MFNVDKSNSNLKDDIVRQDMAHVQVKRLGRRERKSREESEQGSEQSEQGGQGQDGGRTLKKKAKS